MKKYLLFFAVSLFFVALTTENIFAVTFTGRAPQFSGISLAAQDAINDAFDDALEQANQNVAKYRNQDKLAAAVADSNTYASHAASMWGYQGYDNIALLGGLTIAAQMPTLDYYALDQALKDVEDKGDAQAGIAPSGSVNLGIHLGWLSEKAKGWYLNVKFFMYDMSYPLFGYTLDYETMNVGIGVNYSIIGARRFGKGSFLWRGLSLGFGFNYQQNDIFYKIKIEKTVGDFSEDIYSGDVVVDPSIKMGLTMKTYTVPVDIVTSLRILYFLNISLGVGIDFNYGESSTVAEADGGVSVTGADTSSWGDVTPGYIRGDNSTKGSPFYVDGRFMGGIGITIGPVVVADVQVSYYLLTWVAVNISAGFVW